MSVRTGRGEGETLLGLGFLSRAWLSLAEDVQRLANHPRTHSRTEKPSVRAGGWRGAAGWLLPESPVRSCDGTQHLFRGHGDQIAAEPICFAPAGLSAADRAGVGTGHVALEPSPPARTRWVFSSLLTGQGGWARAVGRSQGGFAVLRPRARPRDSEGALCCHVPPISSRVPSAQPHTPFWKPVLRPLFLCSWWEPTLLRPGRLGASPWTENASRHRSCP